ncbi:hypothetical protein J2Z53_001942 [Clostridium moniliforme]|uniref:Uncharacterized protein n=1 Tax=Clostridium moniliforme TaxID=39489 RepID=A0ABS4F259_9CLOT|nr:hypothetical protein [Clostridium moniliforme]
MGIDGHLRESIFLKVKLKINLKLQPVSRLV